MIIMYINYGKTFYKYFCKQYSISNEYIFFTFQLVWLDFCNILTIQYYLFEIYPIISLLISVTIQTITESLFIPSFLLIPAQSRFTSILHNTAFTFKCKFKFKFIHSAFIKSLSTHHIQHTIHPHSMQCPQLHIVKASEKKFKKKSNLNRTYNLRQCYTSGARLRDCVGIKGNKIHMHRRRHFPLLWSLNNAFNLCFFVVAQIKHIYVNFIPSVCRVRDVVETESPVNRGQSIPC